MFRNPLHRQSKVLLSAPGAALLAIAAIGGVETTRAEEHRDRHADVNGQRTSIIHQHGDMSRLSPISPIRVFRPNPNLEIAFDVRTRNPVYVMERLHIDDDSKSSGNRKRHHFYEEQTLPEAYRSRNSSYHNSGYDRGHLAPAADFDDAKERLDTYSLVNISPQHHELNRKLWVQLEAWTRQVARSSHNRVSEATGTGTSTTTYVVTGPIWLPHHQVHDKLFEYHFAAIGKPPNLVAVPTHFFKLIVVVVADKNDSTVTKFACFVVPNHDIDESAAAARDLSDYLVRWTDLERVTGLEFFPTLVSTEWKQLADSLVVLPAKKEQADLLLADSAASSSSALVSRRQNVAQTMAHLCPQGSCRRPAN